MAALQTLTEKLKALGINPDDVEALARGFLTTPEGMFIFRWSGHTYSLRITQNVCLTDEGPIKATHRSPGKEIVARSDPERSTIQRKEPNGEKEGKEEETPDTHASGPREAGQDSDRVCP